MIRSLGLLVLFASLGSGSPWSPPKLVEGTIPQPFGGGDGEYVLYEARISREGAVTEVIELAGRASFAERFRNEILSWRFEPATTADVEPEPVAASVLVAGVSRSPLLPSALEPLPKTPEHVEASEEVPRPERILLPRFPPQASFDGIVLLEIDIDEDGRVSEGRVVQSSNGFDGVCLDAVEAWKFHPGSWNGDAVATRGYLFCNFRPPPRLGTP